MPLQVPPPPSFHNPPAPSRKGERRDEGEKDHPHWDHSPSIRPFHTLWTWNNQSLIAAVCLEATAAETALDSPQRRANALRLQRKSFSLGCSERLASFLSPATVLSVHCLLYFKANEEIVSKTSDDGNLKVILFFRMSCCSVASATLWLFSLGGRFSLCWGRLVFSHQTSCSKSMTTVSYSQITLMIS